MGFPYGCKTVMGVMHYEKGDIILNMGSVCTHLLFMNKGLARGYLLDEEGKDYTWSLHFNDEYAQMHNLFVTDYESFLHQTPSHTNFSDDLKPNLL